jgi:hypothetical protein
MLPEFVESGHFKSLTLPRKKITDSHYELITADKYSNGQLRHRRGMEYRVRINFNRSMSILNNPFQQDTLRSLLEVGFEGENAVKMAQKIAADERSCRGVCSYSDMLGGMVESRGDVFTIDATAETGMCEPVELMTRWRIRVMYNPTQKQYVVTDMVESKRQSGIPLHLLHRGLTAPKVHVTEKMLNMLTGSCKNKSYVIPEPERAEPEERPSSDIVHSTCQEMAERACEANSLPFPRPPLLCGECRERKHQGRKPRVNCTQMTLKLVDASGFYDNGNTVAVCCLVAQNSTPGVAKVYVHGHTSYLCSTCHKKAEKMKCCGCKCVAYCDATCQKKQWKQHSVTCPLNKK